MRAVAVLGFAVLIGCGKPGEQPKPDAPAQPAAFDANDPSRTLEWAISLWDRVQERTPKGNTLALLAEREAANKDFANIIGQRVKWPMKAGGVHAQGVCYVKWLTIERNGTQYNLAPADIATPADAMKHGPYKSPIRLADPARTLRLADGDTVIVEGTIAEVKLEGSGTEYGAAVKLKDAIAR